MADTRSRSSDTSVDDVTAELKTLRADVGKLSETLASLVENKAEAAKLRAKAKAHEVQDDVMLRIAEAEDAARRNPGMALGLAAAVGFLVGIVMSRKS